MKKIKTTAMTVTFSATTFALMTLGVSFSTGGSAFASDVDPACQYESKQGVVNESKTQACIKSHRRSVAKGSTVTTCSYESKEGKPDLAKTESCLKSHHNKFKASKF